MNDDIEIYPREIRLAFAFHLISIIQTPLNLRKQLSEKNMDVSFRYMKVMNEKCLIYTDDNSLKCAEKESLNRMWQDLLSLPIGM